MSETLTEVWEREIEAVRARERLSIAWHAQEDARNALAAIVEAAGGEITVDRCALHLGDGDRLEVAENPADGTLTFRLRRVVSAATAPIIASVVASPPETSSPTHE